MPGDSLYERDFYTWTQDQAKRLRELTGHNRLDAANLAEEIEDLGRSQIGAVRQHLRQCLVHLIKAAVVTEPALRAYWLSEVLRHHQDALDQFSPGVRQHLDGDRIWRDAVKQANKQLAAYGNATAPARVPGPLGVDDLLAADFDEEAAVDAVARALMDRRA